MIEIDHLVVTGPTLAAAVAHIETSLGVEMGPGGEHEAMGTHNRLISLGPGVYLEAIAINPDAPAPGHPRWYNLDARHAPRFSHWAARTDDLRGTLAAAPEGTGAPMSFTRAAYAWDMAVPETGQLPFDGASPALLQWASAHPADHFADSGCRLKSLHITHPDAGALLAQFPSLRDLSVDVSAGPTGLRATIATPAGDRSLS